MSRSWWIDGPIAQQRGLVNNIQMIRWIDGPIAQQRGLVNIQMAW